MYLKDIIPERMFEDTDFDYKATLQDGNPMKWAKSIVAFANGDGGTIYVGVSDDWVAFGLSKREADEARLQAIRENDRSIFPHATRNCPMRLGFRQPAFIICGGFTTGIRRFLRIYDNLP